MKIRIAHGCWIIQAVGLRAQGGSRSRGRGKLISTFWELWSLETAAGCSQGMGTPGNMDARHFIASTTSWSPRACMFVTCAIYYSSLVQSVWVSERSGLTFLPSNRKVQRKQLQFKILLFNISGLSNIFITLPIWTVIFVVYRICNKFNLYDLLTVLNMFLNSYRISVCDYFRFEVGI